jgi:hypothetical protein
MNVMALARDSHTKKYQVSQNGNWGLHENYCFPVENEGF